VIVLVHGYLAGGFAGKDACITNLMMSEGLANEGGTEVLSKQMLACLLVCFDASHGRLQNFIMRCKNWVFLMAANYVIFSYRFHRIYEQSKCYTPAADRQHFGLCINLINELKRRLKT